jgi:hypothetical protein
VAGQGSGNRDDRAALSEANVVLSNMPKVGVVEDTSRKETRTVTRNRGTKAAGGKASGSPAKAPASESAKDQVIVRAELEAEIDAMIDEAEELVGTGEPEPEVLKAIIAGRKMFLQNQIVALRVDLQIAVAMEEQERLQNVRDACRRVLAAIRRLNDMKPDLDDGGPAVRAGGSGAGSAGGS